MEIIERRLLSQGRVFKGAVLMAFTLVALAWLLNTPPGVLGKADAIGYAVCHRIALRSFFLGERQLPLCARCSGMYLGAMLGLVYQWMYGRRRKGNPPWFVTLPAAIMVIGFIGDGLNSFLSLIPGAPHLYPPNNTLRLITGSGMGLGIAIALFPAFNASVWKESDSHPALGRLRDLVILLLLAAVLDALILLDHPLILYPLALITAAGVIVLLTLGYTMMVLVIFKAENRYNRFIELMFPMLAGLTLALVQIGLLDLLRYAFTGTWEGFHLG